MKFSVILLMYNSTLQQTLLTVKSIVLQNLKMVELIIADDGSECKWEREIRTFCGKYKFYNLKFAESTTNVGTVNNILRALELANGLYVKVIGAGDLFWDESTLKNVYENMVHERVKCAFCNFRGYAIEEKKIINRYFAGPFIKKPYLVGDTKTIKKNMIVFSDYILGAAFFYEKNCLKKSLDELSGVVKYAEDLAQIIVVLDNNRILYIPQKQMIYEVGSGISTSNNASGKMKSDADNFKNNILTKYNDTTVEQKRKYDEIANRSRMQYCIIKILAHPIWCLRRFRRAHMRFEKRKNLGFLDQQGFIEEFGLLRR